MQGADVLCLFQSSKSLGQTYYPKLHHYQVSRPLYKFKGHWGRIVTIIMIAMWCLRQHNCYAVPISQPQQAVRLQARADTAYSTDWTPEEQVALDATLDKYPAARHTPLERYVRAAAALPKKGVRDVALRVIWLANNATKRRAQDDNTAKKRPRVQSIFAVQPKGVPPMGLPANGVPGPGYPSTMQASPYSKEAEL